MPATTNAKAVEVTTPTAPLPAATSAGSDQGSSTPRLFGSVSRAMKRAEARVKDAKNAHMGYGYVKSESILAECREALSAEGLCLVPLHMTIGSADGVTFVESTFVLGHESGESLTITRQWPYVTGNGRPADKAVAGCSTTLLAYLLRDIFELPRQDENEADSRDDREHRPPPKRSPKGDIKAMTPSEPKGGVKVTTPSDGPPPGVEADDVRDQVRALLPKLPEVERKLYESAVKAAGDDVPRLREGLGKLKARVEVLSKAVAS